MKKVNYEDLGNYFKERAEKEFGGYYSEDTRDWEDDMLQAEYNASYNEDDDLYACKLEVAKVGKQPLLIEYSVRYIFNKDDEVENIEYYIY